MSIGTKEISEYLASTGILAGYDGRSSEEPIEWETAFSLNEILTSTSKIEHQLLPALLSASDPENAVALLEEIREELRHVVYHIGDASYFSVIME